MDRSSVLQSIRPTLKKIVNNAETTEVELLQNLAIRPILKTQNNLIVALFLANKLVSKERFLELSADERELFLVMLLNKQVVFRNQLIGTVIGLLTLEEFDIYQKHTAEINKRILSMVKQRILSNL